MSIKYICDRCGDEISQNTMLKPKTTKSIEIRTGFDWYAFDICDECYKDIASKFNILNRDLAGTIRDSIYCQTCDEICTKNPEAHADHKIEEWEDLQDEF